MPRVEYEEVRARLDAVIEAMKHAGVWDVEEPSGAAYGDMGPFGMNTMAFVQWLRWVFVPNVEALIEKQGPWPRSSSVSVQAAREGDTDPAVDSLVDALSRFDDLFGETDAR